MSEPIRDVETAVRELGALPVPSGPEPLPLSVEQERAIRSLDLLALMDDRAAPVISGHLAALLGEIDRLRAERHSTNEALDDAVQALRERGQREAIVAEFVAARAGYIVAIRNCHPDNGHDYDRWQGHAEARRQLAGLLGLPVAWPPEDDASVAKSADKLTALLAPTQALREGEHYAVTHHDYLKGRDLPGLGGAE